MGWTWKPSGVVVRAVVREAISVGVEAGAGVVVGAEWAAVEGGPVVADVEEFGLAVGAGGGLLLFEELALRVGDFFRGVDCRFVWRRAGRGVGGP